MVIPERKIVDQVETWSCSQSRRPAVRLQHGNGSADGSARSDVDEPIPEPVAARRNAVNVPEPGREVARVIDGGKPVGEEWPAALTSAWRGSGGWQAGA
jgi:hypothetical protein